ncbi:TPA: hypothetical protein ACX6QN_000656 [Photobacterium damselae]|uniref:hypothetical protein n=1 Tax=Photobacterium damselae TaxID=38293 RepID=UPI00370A3324
MTHRTFLRIHGFIYALFALALFFIPTILWPLYGVQINDRYALFLSQHTSIFLGGIAAICLLLQNITEEGTTKQLLKALLATNILGLVITTYACLMGILVTFGWSDPAFFLLLSVLVFRQLKTLG